MAKSPFFYTFFYFLSLFFYTFFSPSTVPTFFFFIFVFSHFFYTLAWQGDYTLFKSPKLFTHVSSERETRNTCRYDTLQWADTGAHDSHNPISVYFFFDNAIWYNAYRYILMIPVSDTHV